jgi:hypothetical protein
MISKMNTQTTRPVLNFRSRFERAAARLALDSWLSEDELRQLREAAFYDRLCNIAFNGLGGCGGQIRPDRELNRIALERAFTKACQAFWSSQGAQRLPDEPKGMIRGLFLSVSVSEQNLA